MLTKLCQFWWKYTLKLTSAFNTPSLLKARILMLYRKPSAKVAFAKYGFALPMLVLCVLITAFTQRERILPTSLRTEVGKVAERFGKEMQKAFLPNVAEKEIVENESNVEIIEEIKENSSSEGKTVLNNLPNLPIEKAQVSHVEMKTVGKEATPHNNPNLNPRYPDFTNFTFLKSYGIDFSRKSSIKFSYIFTKGNTYLVTFIDCFTHQPTNQKMPFKIKDSEGYEMSLELSEKGYVFTSNTTGMYHLVFEKGTDEQMLKAVLYFSRKNSERVNESREVFLADMRGKKINLQKKVSVKNDLQVLFEPNEKTKDSKIEQLQVNVFRGGRSLDKHIFKGNTIDFKGMNLKRGDGIQIVIVRASIPVTKPYIGFFVK